MCIWSLDAGVLASYLKQISSFGGKEGSSRKSWRKWMYLHFNNPLGWVQISLETEAALIIVSFIHFWYMSKYQSSLSHVVNGWQLTMMDNFGRECSQSHLVNFLGDTGANLMYLAITSLCTLQTWSQKMAITTQMPPSCLLKRFVQKDLLHPHRCE